MDDIKSERRAASNRNQWAASRWNAWADKSEFAAWVQMVRSHGIPLDARTLQLISQRTTLTTLINALPGTGVRDDNLYFTGATGALFPAVVMATMDGTTLPAHAFGQASAAPHAGGNPEASVTEQPQ